MRKFIVIIGKKSWYKKKSWDLSKLLKKSETLVITYHVVIELLNKKKLEPFWEKDD